MPRSLSELEKKLSDLEYRFREVENLNNLLARQAREYYLLFDSTRKINSTTNVKDFLKILDKVFRRNFNVDEYAFIQKNPKSDLLTVSHSMGLSKRKLREIFYRINQGLVGKVFSQKKAVYIPDVFKLKVFYYYFEKKSIKGSLYYMPVLDNQGNCIGVIKLRKILKDSFSEVERSVLASLQIEIGMALQNVEKFELLNSKSYVDELTRLYNRRYYNEHFPIEFKRAQRYRHALSLMFIDIDNFKDINDQYGHSIGDLILINVGNFIQRMTRSSDICIRYGGDEFLILLPETKKEDALGVGEKLKKAVEEMSPNLDGLMDDLIVSLSLGIANFPEDTIEPQMLIELADKALYKAKKSGKDRIVLANSVHNTKIE